MVSVVVPFHNAGAFLGETIQSVRAQGHEDWELVLVDDASTDNGAAVADDFARQDSRIRCLRVSDGPCGASVARNVGLKATSGDIVAFLDADDVWFPNKLEEQVRIFRDEPHASMLYGQTEYWHSWSGEGATPDFVPGLGVEPGLVRPPDLLVRTYPLGAGNAPSLSNVAARRSAVERIGGFVEELSRSVYEDQAFLAKAYLTETFMLVDTVWDRYRQHSASVSAQVEQDGSYRNVRVTFLRWLRGYLEERPQADERVLGALRAALFLAGDDTVPPTPISAVEGIEVRPGSGLLGANVEAPDMGRLVVREMGLSGWVLGRSEPVTRVHVQQRGEVVHSFAVDRPRPDLAAAWPDRPDAPTCGFTGFVDTLLLKPGALEVEAVWMDGQTAHVATIVVR